MIESASNTSRRRRQVWLARMRQRDACWVWEVTLKGSRIMSQRSRCGSVNSVGRRSVAIDTLRRAVLVTCYMWATNSSDSADSVNSSDLPIWPCWICPFFWPFCFYLESRGTQTPPSVMICSFLGLPCLLVCLFCCREAGKSRDSNTGSHNLLDRCAPILDDFPPAMHHEEWQ